MTRARGESGEIELDTDNGQIIVLRDAEPVGAGQR